MPKDTRHDKQGIMGKDIILLGIGALFGLGVALVSLAIPAYLPNLSPWIAFIAFWSGLALMAVMVLDAALLYLWWGREGSKLGPTLFINLGLCLIVAGFVWHYAPSRLGNKLLDGDRKGVVESASARLSYAAGIPSGFSVIARSAGITSISIKTSGILGSIVDQTFTFQVAFSNGRGPFDISLSARDDRYPNLGFQVLDIWIPVQPITVLENTDNFVEFRVAPYLSILSLVLPLRNDPIDMRLSFLSRKPSELRPNVMGPVTGNKGIVTQGQKGDNKQ